MKIIYNDFIPFKGFTTINLFGVIFARKECRPLTPTTLRHLRIHTAQMRELLYIGFYLLYALEWITWIIHIFIEDGYLTRDLLRESQANISFEREAYKKQGEINYLDKRKCYAQWRRKV